MNNCKMLCIMFILAVFSLAMSAQTKIELVSPNKEIKVSLNIADKIYYTVAYNNDVLLQDNHLKLALRNEVLGLNPKLSKKRITQVDEVLTPEIPLKFSTVRNFYNQLRMDFRGGYSVEFRAYDDGVAYRFITQKKGEIEVMREDFSINFPAPYILHLQQPRSFKTGYEEPYTHVESKKWIEEDKMAVLPLLIDTQKKYKILVSESDLSDYPCMFLKGNGQNGLASIFPNEPLEFGEDGDRSLKLIKEADYIAKTSGKRSFPWRYLVITKDDRQLIENTMTYKLATKNVIGDVSWVKPGQVSWEWWNDACPYGPDVNFVSGYNLDTYKYYIDFASKFGISSLVST